MKDLFPELPRDANGDLDLAALAALSDDELQAQLDAATAAKDKIRDQDPEFLGDLSAADVLEQMKVGVSAILAMKAVQAERVEAETKLAAELAALDAQIEPAATLEADDAGDDDSDGDADDGDDTADADASATADVAEAVVAAAAPPTLRRMPAAGRHTAPGTAREGAGPAPLTLRATAGMTRYAPEHPFTEQELSHALAEQIMVKTTMPAGARANIVVAHGEVDKASVPAFRRLDGDGGQADTAKIEAMVASARAHGVGYDGDNWAEAEALTASGGICAPVTPYYELAFISTMARPIRDSLVAFIADRGGIRYGPPPYLGQITDGVGVISAADDAAGGSLGTKSCQVLICPEFVEVDVESIYHCFEGGNLGQRAFPEQAAQFSSLILAQHARVAETQLLNAIKAGSTQVTGQTNAASLGATSSLLNDILTAAAAYRSNNRMTQDAPLQIILPAWTADLLVIDIIQSQFQRFQFNQTGVEQLLGTFNVRVTWTIDGPTDGDGQVLNRQAAGAMDPLPTQVEWALRAQRDEQLPGLRRKLGGRRRDRRPEPLGHIDGLPERHRRPPGRQHRPVLRA